MRAGGYKVHVNYKYYLTYIQIYQYVSLYEIIYGEKQYRKNYITSQFFVISLKQAIPCHAKRNDNKVASERRRGRNRGEGTGEGGR